MPFMAASSAAEEPWAIANVNAEATSTEGISRSPIFGMAGNIPAILRNFCGTLEEWTFRPGSLLDPLAFARLVG
jgi:hypothetical protein